MKPDTILVIDDDARLRRTVRAMLHTQAFRVLEANNEAEGVALAELHNPDLILCDINMDQGDGYSILKKLRGNPVTALIPFILMTGRPTEEGMRRGMTQGADDYLQKPFQGSDLFATIHARLKKKQLLKQQAKETEARLVATLEATPDFVAIADKDRRCVYINQAGRKMLGITDAEDISQLLIDQFVSSSALVAIEAQPVSGSDRPNAEAMWSGESALSIPGGGELPVSQVVLANKGAGGEAPFYSIIARDISQRKRAEATLQQTNKRLQILSANLVNIQEAERRHLARELHDEIGQALTATKIHLQGLQLRLNPDPAAQQLNESIALVDRLLHQVRNLSLDLRPPLLDDLGLVAALRWYIDQLSQRAGIHARFIADLKTERVTSTLETTCFRVAQEALTNIVRHSQAKKVVVTITQEKDSLHLAVRDDGVGFDWQAMRARAVTGKSLGLLGMEERVSLVGGTLSIESIPTGGTSVSARFPIIDVQNNQASKI